jgi:arabinofuranan 3-O-arabinosyltransferase
LVLLGAVGAGRTGRRRRGLPAAPERAAPGTLAAAAGGPVTGVVVLALVGGPMAGAALVLGVLARWRAWVAPVVAVGAMTAAGIVAAVDVQHGLAPGHGAFGPVAQACALTALAAALSPWVARPRPGPTEGEGLGAATANVEEQSGEEGAQP